MYSFVQIYGHLGLWPIALAFRRNDDEAIRLRRRGKDGRPAEGNGFDSAIDKPHAAIVDTADGGNNLAGDNALAGPMRPGGQTPTAQSNGAAGKEIVGAQTRDRI